MRIDPRPNTRRGFLAGAVGGLIACFAMSQFHSFFQKVEASAAGLQGTSVTISCESAKLRPAVA